MIEIGETMLKVPLSLMQSFVPRIVLPTLFQPRVVYKRLIYLLKCTDLTFSTLVSDT